MKFTESIGEAIGEFHAIVFCHFEGEGKPDLKFLPFILRRLSLVADVCASAFPFLSLFAVTHLHSLVIEAWTFPKSSDDEIGLAFDAFDHEIEPVVPSWRVCLVVEGDLEAIVADEFHSSDAAALEIASESGASHLDYLADPNTRFFSCWNSAHLLHLLRRRDKTDSVLFSEIVHFGMTFDSIFRRRVHLSDVDSLHLFLDMLELVLTVLPFLFISSHYHYSS